MWPIVVIVCYNEEKHATKFMNFQLKNMKFIFNPFHGTFEHSYMI